jgi:hypothetical protein
MTRCCAPALLALLFAAALTSAAAHRGGADEIFNALAARSRAVAGAQAARQHASVAHAVAALAAPPLPGAGGARRRLGEGAPEGQQGQQGQQGRACSDSLPCVQSMSSLFSSPENASALYAITDAAACPWSQASTDKCFYVRAPAQRPLRFIISGAHAQSVNKPTGRTLS